MRCQESVLVRCVRGGLVPCLQKFFHEVLSVLERVPDVVRVARAWEVGLRVGHFRRRV